MTKMILTTTSSLAASISTKNNHVLAINHKLRKLRKARTQNLTKIRCIPVRKKIPAKQPKDHRYASKMIY